MNFKETDIGYDGGESLDFNSHYLDLLLNAKLFWQLQIPYMNNILGSEQLRQPFYDSFKQYEHV